MDNLNGPDGPSLLGILLTVFEEAGVPRQELADAADVSVTAISQYRSEGSSRRWPSYPVFERLLRFASQKGLLKKVQEAYGAAGGTHLPPRELPPWYPPSPGGPLTISRRVFDVHSVPVVFTVDETGRFGAHGDTRTAGLDAPAICFGASIASGSPSLQLRIDSVTIADIRSIWLVLHPIVLPIGLDSTSSGQLVLKGMREACATLADVLAETQIVFRATKDDPFGEVYRAPVRDLIVPVGAAADHILDLTDRFSRTESLPKAWEHSIQGNPVESVENYSPRVLPSNIAALELEVPQTDAKAFAGFYMRATLCALVETNALVGALAVPSTKPLDPDNMVSAPRVAGVPGADSPEQMALETHVKEQLRAMDWPLTCVLPTLSRERPVGRTSRSAMRIKTRLRDRLRIAPLDSETRQRRLSPFASLERHLIHSFEVSSRAKMILRKCRVTLPALPADVHEQRVILASAAEFLACAIEIDHAPFPTRIPVVDFVVAGEDRSMAVRVGNQLEQPSIEVHLPAGSMIDCRYAGSKAPTGAAFATDATPDVAEVTLEIEFVEEVRQEPEFAKLFGSFRSGFARPAVP